MAHLGRGSIRVSIKLEANVVWLCTVSGETAFCGNSTLNGFRYPPRLVFPLPKALRAFGCVIYLRAIFLLPEKIRDVKIKVMSSFSSKTTAESGPSLSDNLENTPQRPLFEFGILGFLQLEYSKLSTRTKLKLRDLINTSNLKYP